MFIIRDAHPSDAAEIARVHVETWQAAYSGIIADETLKSMSISQIEESWKHRLAEIADDERQFTLCAEEGEQLFGFADGGPNRSHEALSSGELYALYIQPNSQRRGIGCKLVAHAAQRLLDAGYTSMNVLVLAENPACRFYEKLDGILVDSRTETIRSQVVKEVEYSWRNLLQLVAKASMFA